MLVMGGTPRGNSPVGHAGSGREHAGSFGDVHDAAILTVAEEITTSIPESTDEKVELLVYNIEIKYPVRVVSEELAKLKDLNIEQAQRTARTLHTRCKQDSNMSIPLKELQVRFSDIKFDVLTSPARSSYSWWCCPRRS